MPEVKNEPVLTALTSAVAAAIALLVAFGVAFTTAQTAAITLFVGALYGLFAIVRSRVRPVAKRDPQAPEA